MSADPASQPMRLTTSEVAALARISTVTLWRCIKAGAIEPHGRLL